MYPSCIHQPGSFHCIGFPAGSLSRARAESTSCRSMVLAGWLNGMAGYPLGPRTPKGRRNWRMFLYVYITLYIYIDSIIDCNYMYVCTVCIYVRKSSLHVLKYSWVFTSCLSNMKQGDFIAVSIYDSYDGWFPIGGGGGGGALQDTSGLQQFKFKEFKGNLRNFQV